MADPIVLTVPDMVCQGCVDAVAEAVRRVAPQVQIDIDLANKQVWISDGSDREQIEASVQAAGYCID
jgi:copper chaperone CopZ